MHHMTRRLIGRGGAAFALLTVLAIGSGACGDEVVDPSSPGTGGTGGDGGGEGGAGATGGQGGEIPEGRGNPADFPTDCIEECAEACDRLEMCGGATSSLFPLEEGDCKTRCGLAANGPIWDDVSQNFLCCATQDSCDAVEHCGGWLAHPDAEASCDRVCGCFFSATLAALSDGKAAPDGFAFAKDVVVVEVGEASLDRAGLGDVRVERTGRYAEVRFGERAGQATLDTLLAMGRVLPTFRDRLGRVVAASGRLVVKAPSAAERDRAEALTKDRGASTPRRMKLPGALYVIEHADAWRALESLAALRAEGIVAEADMIRHYESRYVPDDPRFDDQWHLLNDGTLDESAGDPTTSVDARVSEAWDITLGDPQIIVAINDDGVDLDHPDFAGRLEPELSYPSDWKALIGQGLFGGHGTSVAGVAAAGADDAVGGAGVCPACRVLPHRLGESNQIGGFQLSDIQIAQGFEAQVDAGAAVINNSWGYGLGDPTFSDASLPVPPLAMVVSASFDYAETMGRSGLGTVIVFAAGNHNQELDPNGTHPLTVAVAAVGDVGTKAYYSAFGAEVTVAAPSNGGIGGITTASAGGGQTESFGGTSSASPLVAGLAGLVLSANSALTAAEVRDILQQSATAIDPIFGAYDGNGRSVYYGAGMVNAYVAVQLATGACVDAATCVAPSDDCAAQCGTKAVCEACRTAADCATGHVCQALPSLGEMICVPEEGSGCGAGTNLVNGYCIPTPTTCALCDGPEACNGRDDDCDGDVDEDDVCMGAPRCFADGPGCPSGQVCAGTRCVDACSNDEACGEGGQCKPVKDQYGTVSPAVQGCVQDQAGLCQVGCTVLASSVDDATLASFVDCMMDGNAQCGAAFSCVQLLPVTF
jgi:subtilisin family serine protease